MDILELFRKCHPGDAGLDRVEGRWEIVKGNSQGSTEQLTGSIDAIAKKERSGGKKDWEIKWEVQFFYIEDLRCLWDFQGRCEISNWIYDL